MHPEPAAEVAATAAPCLSPASEAKANALAAGGVHEAQALPEAAGSDAEVEGCPEVAAPKLAVTPPRTPPRALSPVRRRRSAEARQLRSTPAVAPCKPLSPAAAAGLEGCFEWTAVGRAGGLYRVQQSCTKLCSHSRKSQCTFRCNCTVQISQRVERL